MTRNSVATSRSRRCIASISARNASTMSARATSYRSTRCSVINLSNRSKGPAKTSVWTSYATRRGYRPHAPRGRIPALADSRRVGRTAILHRWSGSSQESSRQVRRTSATTSVPSASGSPTSTAPTRSSASSTCTPSRSTTTPLQLRNRTLETASWLFASGLDPEVCTVFIQSHVHEHTQLAWLLECTATVGELRPHDPVQGEERRKRVGARRAVHLPGAHGGRHPPLRHRQGAGR